MIKDINKFNLNDLFKEIGKLITPEDVYSFLEPEFYSDFDEILKIIDKDFNVGRELLYDFLIANEEKVDKPVLVLITLENYYRTIVAGKFNEQERQKAEIMMEKCKELLDGEDISIYKHNTNSKTGMVDSIFETSSVELCSIESKLYIKSERLKKLEKKRQDAVEKRKQAREKKRNKNLEQINEINENVPIEYILQFIAISDIDNVLVPNRNMGEAIRFKVLRNTLIEDMNLPKDKVQEMLYAGDLDTISTQIKTEAYLNKFKQAVYDYAEYFDINKMLMYASYRAIERLDHIENTPEILESVHSILNYISDFLKKKNAKISCEVDDIYNQGKKFVKYDKNDLKRDLERFAGNIVFLTDEKIAAIKEDLLSKEGKFSDYDTQVLVRLGLTIKEWEKLVKSSSENFEYFIDEFEYIQEDIDEILEDVEEIKIECLYKLIEKQLISEDKIKQLILKKVISLEDIVHLATIEEVSEKIIIETSNQLVENGEQIPKEIIFQYFEIDKLDEYVKDKKVTEEFAKFYYNILPEDENARKVILDDISKIIIDVEDKDTIKNLFAQSLIGLKDIENKLDEYDLMQMYEAAQINMAQINYLNQKGIIKTETFSLIAMEEYDGKDVLELLENEQIDLEVAMQLYDTKKVYNVFEKYEDDTFKSALPALFGFAISDVDIEQINDLYKQGIVKEEDLYMASKQGIYDFIQIKDLYLNLLISEDIVNKLAEEKIITEHQQELMKKTLSMKSIMKNMDKSLGIVFGSSDEIEIEEGIFLPEEKMGNSEDGYYSGGYTDQTTNLRIKTVISPAIREKKFEGLGARRVRRDNVEYNEKSPFNDYEFYVIPKPTGEITPDCIVIAERYYEDKYSGDEKLVTDNATYIFQLKDLTRISKKSKKEILAQMNSGEDSRMKRKLHTKHWAKNLDKAIAELQNKKLESCYTKEELNQIKVLSELIDGFEEKGEIVRLFDVEVW